MTTPARRFAQPLAALALFNGLLYLCLCDGAYAADKEAEAKRYAETLRKGKDAGVRAAAAICLGQCDEPGEKAVPVLVKMLKEDKSEAAKIGAAKGLGAM